MAESQIPQVPGQVPQAFLRALAQHEAGKMAVPALAEALRAAIGRDVEAAQAVQAFLENEGAARLPAEAVAALLPIVDAIVTEDIPTSWSQDADGAALAATDVGALVPAGTVLRDRYELLELVRSSAMGLVFRARDHQPGGNATEVAIKLVPAGMPRAEQATGLLRHEAEVARRLDHPALVRVHALDRDGDSHFLVMEWLGGETLASVLDRRRSRPMPRLQALQIIEATGRALAHAHDQGLVHGDVKPGNIFITEDGQPRLLDFGTSAASAAGGAAPRGFTPEYASCEVLAGEAAAPADDLYSLAAVAYRLLAGRRPFAGTALAARQAGEKPPVIDNLPAGQWRALSQALAFRREERQSSVTEFLAQLKGPREEHAVRAEPAGGTLDSAATADRGGLPRWVPAGALAGGLLAVGALAGWMVNGGSSGEQTVAATTTVPLTPVKRSDPGPAPSASELALAAPAVPVPAPAVAQADDAAAAGTSAAPPARSEPRTQPPAAAAVAQDGGGPSPVPGAPGRAPQPAMLASANPAAALGPGSRGAAGSPPDVPVDDDQNPAATAPPATGALPASPVAPATGNSGKGAVAGADVDEAASPGEVRLADLDLKRYVPAEYPRTAAMRRRAGWVDVGFAVDDDGKPTEVVILGADPPEIFDDAALNAVRRWRFAEPAKVGLSPGVRSRVRVRFEPD